MRPPFYDFHNFNILKKIHKTPNPPPRRPIPTDKSTIKTREASRAILFDENNLVPLLFVSKHNYHKLPGGGVDEGENKEETLIRECLEEIGCKIKIINKIGKVTFYRSQRNFEQTSYCYHGKIISKGTPDFTESEIENGFQIVRLSIEDAISTIKNDKPDDYHGSCIQKRDIIFLEELKN